MQQLVVHFDAPARAIRACFLLELEAGGEGVPVVLERGVEGRIKKMLELQALLLPVVLDPEGASYISSDVEQRQAKAIGAQPSLKLHLPHLHDRASEVLKSQV